MPSPFPGMNPYLEQAGVWRGFHNLFLGQLAYALSPQVTPRYYVEYEESLFLELPDGRRKMFAVADTSVAFPRDRERRRERGGTAAVLNAPLTATLPDAPPERAKRRWLTVRDSQRRSVVTVIEMLSPSDKKPGADRERYLAKRGRVLETRAHLVEIDLLRGGERMPVSPPPACDYCVVVSRRQDRPRAGVWPVGLRDRLPAIPVPLRNGEPPATVDLQAALHAVYDGIGYGRRIYADGTPDPPLSADDAAWAAGFVPVTPSPA